MRLSLGVKFRRVFQFLVLVTLLSSLTLAAVPRVVVTIKPIHSLVAGVMEGVGEPVLLLDGKTSPHHHHLRPSEEQQLNGAQLVIWVGPIYESFLAKRMELSNSFAQVLTIKDMSGLELYPLRQFSGEEGEGAHEDCCSADHSSHEVHNYKGAGKDGHLWLAPHNAKVIVSQIAKELGRLDREHAAQYLANSQKIIKKIADLTLELEEELKEVGDKPYLTFHDFTQYFDRAFGTQCGGVVRRDPALSPSPRHLQALKSRIRAQKGYVLFTEPQFYDKTIKLLAKEGTIPMAMLDYLGYDLEPGPNLYFEMMRRLAFNMRKALRT